MRGALAVALVVVTGILLAGCSQGILDTKWGLEDTAKANSAAIQRLKPGMSLNGAAGMMAGEPYLADSYNGRNGEKILVYKYLTRPAFDYKTLKGDDLTPLVFVNEVLDGWGWPHLESASAKYGFVSRGKDR